MSAPVLARQIGRTLLIRSSVLPSVAAGFKSAYSLDKIYPNSALDITKPVEPPKNEGDKFSGYIPIKELEVSYSRSSGPGGQNVNKVNTRVEIRFQVETASWLPESARHALLQKYATRITREGYLCVKSDRTRHQHLNMADAMDRIRYLIEEATKEKKEPDPETVERHRRLHERANRQRLKDKRMHSLNKRQSQEI